MNSYEAKFILNASREKSIDADDPKLAEAFQLMASDPELARWFEQCQALDQSITSKLRSIEVPPGLIERIHAGNTLSHAAPASWFRRPWIALAAAFTLLAVSTWFLLGPRTSAKPATFEVFRAEMAEFMDQKWDHTFDLANQDYSKLQAWLAAKSQNLDLPAVLAASKTYGCKTFKWHGVSATLVCFVPGTSRQVVHVLAVDRSAVLDDPGSSPVTARVGNWNSATWSRGDKVYVALTTAPTEQLTGWL